jgi:hypothetical protein
MTRREVFFAAIAAAFGWKPNARFSPSAVNNAARAMMQRTASAKLRQTQFNSGE